MGVWNRSEFGSDVPRVQSLVDGALGSVGVAGELFVEEAVSEFMMLEGGVLQKSDFNVRSGFSLRGYSGAFASYANSSRLDFRELDIAAGKVLENLSLGVDNASGSSSVPAGHCSPATDEVHPYSSSHGFSVEDFNKRLMILQEIDAYARSKSREVQQVTVALAVVMQDVKIFGKGGVFVEDLRPMIRLMVKIVMERNGRREYGYSGVGGRKSAWDYLADESWKIVVDEAFRQACVSLESSDAPAGEMIVVLGKGWPGILLHEAIGHGLEADFNRQGVSAYTGMLGQKIANPGVTVVDDGTVGGGRGSLKYDDEGNYSRCNVLIEDGRLVRYMSDAMNSALMGSSVTANGRRESYLKPVMPRMTTTYMLPGQYEHDEIIGSVKRGVYAANFGGGQVDITSGKFVFSAVEAYLIEGGKITSPVKNVMLIGNGPDVLTKVSMVGNNLAIDPGIGVCSKLGSDVPVGVGLPTVKIDSITVGGTLV